MDNDSTGYFWASRLRKYGHTGWADPIIYGFDQQERLAIVDKWLSAKRPTAKRMLDFGCGSGDFSRLFIKRGFYVCGYDPYVKTRIDSEQFYYARTLEEIPFKEEKASLAISITTLDHILDDIAAKVALDVIRECLIENGSFWMLEYAIDSTSDIEQLGLKNSYQAFRTLDRWTRLLGSSGFRIADVVASPHPVRNPSPSYLTYKHSIAIRILEQLRRVGIPNSILGFLAKRKAAQVLRHNQTMPQGSSKSPLKQIHCVAV
jgi:SAM-dependent methyltransferase